MDDHIDKMEADVRKMAQAIRPAVQQVPPMPRTDDKVTITHLRGALSQLTESAMLAAETTWAQAKQLSGLEEPTSKREPQKVPDGPVFEGLARQIGECAQQLARLKRAQDAIARALS
jgi:hypothetical protein